LPLELLPRAVQRIAPFLPAYHLGQIANAILGESGSAVPQHLEALFGFGCLFAGVAWIAYSRERAKMYG
jgi:ABC-2 type transport system permease protein